MIRISGVVGEILDHLKQAFDEIIIHEDCQPSISQGDQYE